MKKCPKCGAKLLRIVYGLPTQELGEASERGEVIIGGCCVVEDCVYHCKNCETDYPRDLTVEYD